ncbi:hypothetical protein L2E82_13040 [Cichorium intybus]|uniref:Uncharacterized protein n=1 Tax=Cichorium intybus TaxID=13427 RepID=A0ACB9GH70_CICIN|nr:hypothetical protein L2E82_13040 [Cichorium intybus]
MPNRKNRSSPDHFYADERYVNWTLRITSIHDKRALIPFIKSVEASSDSLKRDKDHVFWKLKGKAVKGSCCGQNSVIVRSVIMGPKSEITVRAIVTNIRWYDEKMVKTSGAGSLNNGSLKRRKRRVG